METRPYEQRDEKGETLPMGWADGRTVPSLPEPPAFGTVLPAPGVAMPRRGRGAIVGLGVGLLIGGLALGGAVWWLGRGAPTDGAAKPAGTVAEAGAGTPSSTKPDAPAPVAAVAAPSAPPSRCPTGMAYVEGGKFFMGTDADDPVLQTARPAHNVEVASFCIDIDEVTLGQYRECSLTGECKRAFRDSTWPQGSSDEGEWKAAMAAHSELCNENFDSRDDHPVNCVDWQQAQSFCKRRGGDLPSEAQWEFAARGSDGRVYSWGDAVPTPKHMNGSGKEYVAWRGVKALPPHGVLYDTDDGFIGTAPVHSFPEGTTQYGLHDIAGNVFEWTLDEFRPYDDADKPATPGKGPRKRVIRGGAFNSFQPQFADPALRFPQVEDAHNHGIGFRCAAVPKPSE